MNCRMAIKQMGGLASAVLLTSASVKASASGIQAAAPAPAPTVHTPFPPLPYAYDALEPYIDAETMHLHHDKHHQSYVDKLNAAVAGHPESPAIGRRTGGQPQHSSGADPQGCA